VLFLDADTNFLDTKILARDQKCILSTWQSGTWKLCYQATRDGFSNSVAHQACNSKGPTFVITKSSAGYVFGGYSSRSWNSAEGYYTVPSAYLFTLSNPSNIAPRKILQKNVNSVYDSDYYGFGFGDGFDFQPMGTYYARVAWIVESNYDFSDFASIPHGGCHAYAYTNVFLGPSDSYVCFGTPMEEMEIYYYS